MIFSLSIIKSCLPVKSCNTKLNERRTYAWNCNTSVRPFYVRSPLRTLNQVMVLQSDQTQNNCSEHVRTTLYGLVVAWCDFRICVSGQARIQSIYGAWKTHCPKGVNKSKSSYIGLGLSKSTGSRRCDIYSPIGNCLGKGSRELPGAIHLFHK